MALNSRIALNSQIRDRQGFSKRASFGMPDAAPEAGNSTNANYPVVVVYQDLSENFDIMHDVSSDAWTW